MLTFILILDMNDTNANKKVRLMRRLMRTLKITKTKINLDVLHTSIYDDYIQNLSVGLNVSISIRFLSLHILYIFDA